MRKNRVNISWGLFQQDTIKLAQKLKKYNFDKIVAITRGGLVPAAIISWELDIRMIDTICLSSYDKRELAGEIKEVKSVDGDGENWLIVDDIADTGSTITYIKTTKPKAFFATVYTKPPGDLLVDAYIDKFNRDTWIVFPWEKEK